MRNPDALKDDLCQGEKEVLHGLLMSGVLYPGSEILANDLPRYLPGIVAPEEILNNLAQRGLFETVDGGRRHRCLTLGYRIGATLSEEDIAAPDAGLLHPPPTGWKWPIENPGNTHWDVEDGFLKDTAHLGKDAGLRAELIKAMEAALANPRYGKPQGSARKGQHNTRVSNNFRLFWRWEGHKVVFIEFRSKEDPRVAPRGK